MTVDPTIEEQLLLANTFERAGARLTPRERAVELAVGVGFVVVVLALLWWRPPHQIPLAMTAACLLTMALASSVRFDTPYGFTVATQLAFVPAVFALPLALVPIVTVAALALAHIPQVLRGNFRPDRLWLVVGNAWFAVGPVAVFALSHTAPRHAGAPLLLGALAAQFATDAAASAVRLRSGRGASLATQLREAWVYAIDAALSVVGLLVAEDVHRLPIVVFSVVPLLWLISTFARERHGRLATLVSLNNAYRGTALVLGDVIEADDGYTGEHCRSVVVLALAVADELRLDPEQRRNVEFGALLHDVGKIAIPKGIINKPGELDPHEWTIIKTHTIEGQRMLDRVGGFMRDVGLIIRSHHERWDGHGYPDQLAGELIPIEARIIACCDAWNAMRTDRPYRRGLPYDAALPELEANAGTQFDPDVVRALVKVVRSESANPGAVRSQIQAPPRVDGRTDPAAAALPLPDSALPLPESG